MRRVVTMGAVWISLMAILLQQSVVLAALSAGGHQFAHTMQLAYGDYAQPPSGAFLSPECVPKYVTALVRPPRMPVDTGTHEGPGCYNFHGLKSPECYPKHHYGLHDDYYREDPYPRYDEPEYDEYGREESYGREEPYEREEPYGREEYYPKHRAEHYPTRRRHSYRARAEGESGSEDATLQEAPNAQRKMLSSEEPGKYETQYMGYKPKKHRDYDGEERYDRGSYRGEEHYSEDYPKRGPGYEKHRGYEYEPDSEGYGREEEPYGRHRGYYPDGDKPYGREYYAPWYNPKGKRHGFETCHDDHHKHAPKLDCDTPDCFREYSISTRIKSQDVLPTKDICLPGANCSVLTPAGGTPALGACPVNFTKTDVFGYMATNRPDTLNWPAFTIESQRYKPNRIKWKNEFVDASNHYQQHILNYAIDQTIHWANPLKLGGSKDDSPCHNCTMMFLADPTNNADACVNDIACSTAATTNYTGPIPIVTHVHGMEDVRDYSDGFTEAWFLPAASDLPQVTRNDPYGTWYKTFEAEYIKETCSRRGYERGTASYIYRNTQRTSTAWYHDHTLGLTRLNVYAGLAGFYMVRKFFPTYSPRDTGPELAGLPYPPPDGALNPADVLELPLAIQDRVFQDNNQLWYPVAATDNVNAYPNGIQPPIWIPEFLFAAEPADQNPMMMTVNGRTWPVANIAPNTYRLRLLNGCNARVLRLGFAKTNSSVTDLGNANSAESKATYTLLPFWVVGNEAGFFPAIQGPDNEGYLVMGQAERYDVIVDFSGMTKNDFVYIINTGAEEPFGGTNFGTTNRHTSQVMRFEFNAVSNRKPCPFDQARRDKLNAALLEEAVPNIPGPPKVTRRMALIEDTNNATGTPRAVVLGTFDAGSYTARVQPWSESPVRTDTSVNTVEDWEIINLTKDAHPIHLHEVVFQYISRTNITVINSTTYAPTPNNAPNEELDHWLNLQNCPEEVNDGGPCYAYRDVAQFLPGTATTIRFKTGPVGGLFVWHCHLVEHEDNEMMVPWCIGNPDYINPHTGGRMCPGAPPGPHPKRHHHHYPHRGEYTT